jgi:arylsulfatase A-like enzyme
MIRRLFFIGALIACALHPLSAIGNDRPNIIFIFIDDMGFGDLSCTGNTDVETKNIDRLAREGTLFKQFYVAAPICSPSRVGITTGQYPARHLINSFLAGRKRNRERGMRDFLDPAAPAIARTFRDGGYATAHYGKWHMGGGRDVDDAPLPSAYGFQEHFVNTEGMGPRVDRKIDPKYTWTRTYVDKSIDFINRNRKGPFYLHLWLNDVHDRHEPSPKLMERYEAFADRPFTQRFYAVLDEMDEQLGRLFRHVDSLGLGEKTMCVLTSDNGPTAWRHYYRKGPNIAPGSTAGFRGRKWSLYEGGIRMPLIVRWKGIVPAKRTDEDSVLAAVDFFPTFTRLAKLTPPKVDFDGIDVSEVFLGNTLQRGAPLFWEYGRDKSYLKPGGISDRSPNCAIREGKWKLLINDDGSNLELYDFSQSTAETDNVAEQHPDTAKRLAKRLLDWRASLPVLETDD